MFWESKVKNWNGKLYKVLKGNKSCHGGNFEWDLPKGNNPGDWTPIIENVIMCEKGYHLTTHYAHWSFKKDVSIYEAEGDVVEFDYDKVVCSRARLLKLIENPFPENNIGKNNSGLFNIGFCNSGNWNSGNRNSGNWNFGEWNSGNWNFGNWNSGYFCTGYCYRSNRIFNNIIPKDWKPIFPNWIYFELLPEGYKISWQKAFEKAGIEGIKELLSLPKL